MDNFKRSPMSKMKDEPMQAAEAAAIIEEVFGHRGQLRAVEALGRNPATISRWCTGATPVRPMEARMLRLICELHRQGAEWRPLLLRHGIDPAEVLGRDDVI